MPPFRPVEPISITWKRSWDSNLHPMPWLQISFTAAKDQAADIETALEDLGALSVTFADAQDQPLLEPVPGETRLWDATRVTGLFDADIDPDLLQAALTRRLPPATLATLEQERLADRQWERTWLEDFHPTRFGERLWVCPDGQRPEQADALIMDLDPGLAFGTGTHPTTALCLRWLDAHPPGGQSVLDYGCGSGILAIAALLLGCAAVDAVDYDPQALQATRDNAQKNAVAADIHPLLPDQSPAKIYDLVLANILAGTLIELAPTLTERVRPGGSLLLSGILQEQAESVMAAYRPSFDFLPPQAEQDWVLLQGTRSGN